MKTQIESLLRNLRDEPGFIHGAFGRYSPHDIIEQIERLRASQFRWIPVSEPHDQTKAVFAMHNNGTTGIVEGGLGRYGYTHWAPIPPLHEPPVLTQEQKDWTAWLEYREKHGIFASVPPEQIAFLAGLKAAREQKA